MLVDEALALGEGLGRPLRYVQVNSVLNGSTGGSMMRLNRDLLSHGVESHTCWGWGSAGFHSKAATLRLLTRLDEVELDMVHLRNLHGYYVNARGRTFGFGAYLAQIKIGWIGNSRKALLCCIRY